MRWLFILPMLFLQFQPMAEHKFYVGLTDMVLDEDQNQLQISHRYFLDDMELALSKFAGDDISIAQDMDTLVLSILESYLRNRFLLSVDRGNLDWQFLGYEIDNDLMWCYMECPYTPDQSPLTVSNSVLMEVYPGQTNLVHLDVKGEVHSLFLKSEEYRGTLR